MEIPRDYNAAVDLIERNLRAGRGGKIAYIDDSRQLHLRAARRARRPRGERAARPRPPARAARRARDARHDRLAGAVPRRDQGRHRAGGGEHAAHAGGLRVQLRDSRARALFVSVAAAQAVRRAIQAKLPRPRARGRRDSQLQASCSPRRAPEARRGADHCATTCASGSIRRARPARPRARCTCTAHLHPDRRALREAACSASARTTSCSPPRSCSSPTASATR